MNLTTHETAAREWVEEQNTGGRWGSRATRLVTIETPDAAGVVTLDTDTGEAVVWSVGYASRKRNGCYARLTPRKVRTETVPGATWSERRDAARLLRVTP